MLILLILLLRVLAQELRVMFVLWALHFVYSVLGHFRVEESLILLRSHVGSRVRRVDLGSKLEIQGWYCIALRLLCCNWSSWLVDLPLVAAQVLLPDIQILLRVQAALIIHIFWLNFNLVALGKDSLLHILD